MYFRIFDCWRFAAALLVMAYHFAFGAPYGADAVTSALERLSPLLDMFFMISGFLITTRYRDRMGSWRDYTLFLRRRVARLYPLHLVTTGFFVAVALAAASVHADHYDYAAELADLPFHLLAIHALGTTDRLSLNFVSWSVSAEFFSYAMFPLIAFLIARGGFKALGFGIALWIGALEIASRLGAFPSGHWTGADTLGAYRAFADFTIGAAIACGVEARIVAVRRHTPGLLVLALALAAMALQMPKTLAIALLALSLLLTALAETAAPQSTARLQPLMRVTGVSFGVYLWHPVMEFVFIILVWKRWLEPLGVVDFYLFCLLPMAASVMAAILSQRFLETPAYAWLCGSRRPIVNSAPSPV